MKLEGSLETFPLRELLEMTVYSSVTGVLSVFGALDCGQMYFRNGQIYNASYGALYGLNAVAILFTEPSTRFSFTSDAVYEEENMWGDSLDLINQAEALADRWRTLKLHLSRMSDVPRRLSSLEKAHSYVNPMYWDIFTTIDGARNLSDIAQALGCELIDVCEAIVEMERDKLVELCPPGAIAPNSGTTLIQAPKTNALTSKSKTPSIKTPQAPKVGLFDRLLATMPTPSSPISASLPPAQPSENKSNPSLSRAEEDILRLLRK